MKTLTKVFWLFGRSGAGKATLALLLRDGLANRSIPVICLDGDEMRSAPCSDLGFRPEARLENHRRIAHIARLQADQDFNVVVSTMAPEYAQRDLVTRVLGDKLVCLHIDAPLEVCMTRDPKGIYKRAQAGELKRLIIPLMLPVRTRAETAWTRCRGMWMTAAMPFLHWRLAS